MKKFMWHRATKEVNWQRRRRKGVKESFFVFLLSFFLMMGLMGQKPVFGTNQKGNFKDVPSNHWAKEVIDKAFEKGIIHGVGPGYFAPERKVSRAEFCKMLQGALNLPAYQKTVLPYEDISGKWYFEPVMAMKEAGYLKHFGKPQFLPDKAINREEMANILALILIEKEKTVADESADMEKIFHDFGTISPAGRKYAEICYHAGLIRGIDQSFQPAGLTTRAQAATVLIKLLDLLSDRPSHLGGETESEMVTPYSYLALLAGNSEFLSFSYVEEEKEPTRFYRRNEDRVSIFKTKDMKGRVVTVRILEMGGKVHYILEEAKIIKTYLGPSEDFLIDTLIKAAGQKLIREGIKEDFHTYTYQLPFVQDESIQYTYEFYMKENQLKKVKVAFGDEAPKTYVFSEFKGELDEVDAFVYPLHYQEEVFDYVYDGEHAPPWWEY